jgi:hypothetical protein
MWVAREFWQSTDGAQIAGALVVCCLHFDLKSVLRVKDGEKPEGNGFLSLTEGG